MLVNSFASLTALFCWNHSMLLLLLLGAQVPILEGRTCKCRTILMIQQVYPWWSHVIMNSKSRNKSVCLMFQLVYHYHYVWHSCCDLYLTDCSGVSCLSVFRLEFGYTRINKEFYIRMENLWIKFQEVGSFNGKKIPACLRNSKIF